MSELERRLDELVRAGKLSEAAELAAREGDHWRAAQWFERACEFGRAALEALQAERPRDALRLAVLSGDEAVSDRATSALLGLGDVSLACRVAAELADRGHPRHAAILYHGAGEHEAAAEAFERAGDAVRAASCFDEADKPAKAARVLEAALRAGAASDADALRVELGRLYARHGKTQAAVRVLQQVAQSSPHRPRVLAPLARSLEALGLTQARRDLDGELLSHGVDPDREADDVSSDPGGILFGRYRIVHEVAQTPHARLVQALDELSGRTVALKLLASSAMGTGRDALARFVREARALTQLRHPGVVPLLAYVEDGPAMVLEWMAGGSLRQLMDREILSPARAAEIAGAVLGALAEAHRLGILHRDVKPSNLLFDDGGTARLSDFGAAHLAGGDATVTVGDIGTALYMSPEQRMGRAASVRSDVYSVGVLLYEMLTGMLPNRERLANSLAAAHPDLGEPHDAVVRRMLAERSEDRFETALEARAAIDRLTWPRRIVERVRATPAPAPGAVAAGEPDDKRLTSIRRLDDGATQGRDLWLERDVIVIELDDGELARAAAFARADHPALDAVLRADREQGQLWIEAPRGRPIGEGAALGATEVARLRAALASLHLAGAVHGWVDGAHVYRHGGGVFLAYPLRGREAAQPADDLAALDALARASEGAST